MPNTNGTAPTKPTSPYATAVDRNRPIGSVQGRPVTTYIIDIDVNINQADIANADTIELRVNGRVLRRYTRHSARRAGLITGDDSWT